MKKAILISLFLCLCFLNIFSQTRYYNYIFEGTVIKRDTFNSNENGYINLIVIQITNILRGSPEIKIGTIEMVTETITNTTSGGIVDYNVPDTGMYFCVPAFYPVSKMTFDNSVKVSPLNVAVYFPSGEVTGGFINKDKTNKFKTKEEFYQFLSQYHNIPIPEKKNEK